MRTQDINAFLDWFEGWAENIEETPTAKQWDRLRTRIAGIPRLAAGGPQQTPGSTPDAPLDEFAPGTPLANGRVAMDEKSWRRELRAALEDMGCDEAAMMANQEQFDPRVDPAAIARIIFSVVD